MTTNEMDTRASTLRELQSTIERLTAEADAIKDELKAEMIEQGRDTLTGNGWKASWKVIEGTRLDSKALKTQAPDVFARFTIATRTSRFTIS